MKKNLLSVEQEIRFISSVALLNCVNSLPNELSIYGKETEQIIDKEIPKIKEIISRIPYNDISKPIKNIPNEDLVKIEQTLKKFEEYSEKMKAINQSEGVGDYDFIGGLIALSAYAEFIKQGEAIESKYKEQRRNMYNLLEAFKQELIVYIDAFRTELKNLPAMHKIEKRFSENKLSSEEMSKLLQEYGYGKLLTEIVDKNALFKRYTTEEGCLEDVRYALEKEQNIEILLKKASDF